MNGTLESIQICGCFEKNILETDEAATEILRGHNQVQFVIEGGNGAGHQGGDEGKSIHNRTIDTATWTHSDPSPSFNHANFASDCSGR